MSYALCVCLVIAVCVVNWKESKHYYSTGNPMDRGAPGPKLDRDNLIKDNLGRYYPKTSEMAIGHK